MRALRLLAAWTLFAITALLLVPREHWHGLGHEEHVELPAHHGPAVEASCVQCETGVPVALAAESFAPQFFAVVRCPLPVEHVQHTDLGYTPLTADRGPPATC
ncbi:MAG: hypothetical protein H6592_01075 [Flavobacteriales bacterium]|nr:hypothetical protein [Flavobacteriales bacterium]